MANIISQLHLPSAYDLSLRLQMIITTSPFLRCYFSGDFHILLVVLLPFSWIAVTWVSILAVLFTCSTFLGVESLFILGVYCIVDWFHRSRSLFVVLCTTWPGLLFHSIPLVLFHLEPFRMPTWSFLWWPYILMIPAFLDKSAELDEFFIHCEQGSSRVLVTFSGIVLGRTRSMLICGLGIFYDYSRMPIPLFTNKYLHCYNIIYNFDFSPKKMKELRLYVTPLISGTVILTLPSSIKTKRKLDK